jgi:2',3'-cyclic-nucleotide 2'-phosphodiesterase/3'-nucleotidase
MKQKLILCTSDVHGTLSAYSYLDGSLTNNGLSRYTTAVDQLRKQNEIIVVDNGDSLQGSPLMTYALKIQAKPIPLATVFNRIGVDYVNIGNHDFNYGENALINYLDDLDAICLTSNILYKDVPIGHTVVHQISNDRIALIGLCTDYIPNWEKPEHIKNFRFLDPIETLKQEITKVDVDKIIVFYHGGLERDLIDGHPTEKLTGENVGYAILNTVGVDALFSGHQHRSIAQVVLNKPTLQCALNANEFMVLELDSMKPLLYPVKNYDVDQSVETMIKPFDEQTQIWLDQELGRIQGHDFKIKDAFQARLYKHPYVSFINQVQKEATHADICCTALFNVAIGLDEVIHYRDLVLNYAYPNSLIVKQMTGKILREYLEQCADYFMVKDNQIIVNPLFDEPKPQHFNYDMLDGIEYTLKISNPVGQRVVELKFEGKDIQEDDVFTVAMNNYRASGGGNFHMIPDCPTVMEIQRDMTEIMAEYIQDKKIVTVNHHDNIHIIL